MRIVFIGTGEIGVPTVQALLKSEHEIVGVVTQPDKPVGRAQLVEPPPIENIRSLKPDVIVVIADGRILPRDVLEIPKIACLNLHASLLPRWRGGAPIQAAIAAGDCV